MDMAKPRLSRDDWLDAALSVIADRGVEAVAVEPLAIRLGVTKGSLYWHFRGRGDLIRAAGERWESLATGAVIAELDPVADPGERLARLMAVAFRAERADQVEVAMLAAADHPVLGSVVDRVRRSRMDFLRRIFDELGFTPAVARDRAMIAYAAYVGHLQLRLGDGPVAARTGRRYVRELQAVLTAGRSRG